jgi:hypothetical protein
MEEDELPVAVYVGPHPEALFVASLLQSAGIEANLPSSVLGGGGARLYVRRRDELRARNLIQRFLDDKATQHGTANARLSANVGRGESSLASETARAAGLGVGLEPTGWAASFASSLRRLAARLVA